jgi:hypothetical protein
MLSWLSRFTNLTVHYDVPGDLQHFCLNRQRGGTRMIKVDAHLNMLFHIEPNHSPLL